MKFFLGILFLTFCGIVCNKIEKINGENIQGYLGTFNILTEQVGFCKMQGYDTTNRENSYGPSIYTSGRVQFGVGLSSIYFGDVPNDEGRETCGMCLNITKVQNFPKFSNDLTLFFPNTKIETPFTVMVFDQCKDPICQQDAFLDFDIYGNIPSTNIKFLEWHPIDCPIHKEEDFIELLFCSKDTCNDHNIYTEKIPFHHVIDKYFVSIIPRNMRIPIKRISILKKNEWVEMNYISAIGWIFPFEFDFTSNIFLQFESSKSDILQMEIQISTLLDTPIQLEYRGGIIFNTGFNF